MPLFLADLRAGRDLGVMVGGIAAWLRQRKWRRARPPAAPKPEAARRSCDSPSARAPHATASPPIAAAAAIAHTAVRTAPPAACHAHRHRRRHQPRAHLSGADRRACASVPRRHRGAAAPHPYDPAAVGQRGEAAADAGLDRRSAASGSSAARSSRVFPDNAKSSASRRSTAATC